MHLNEEQLVAHYFHDDDAPAAAEEHLASCAECRAQYDSICRVLTIVSESPVPERGDDYGHEVWTRLRWRLGKRNSRLVAGRWLVTAAVLAIGLCTGSLVINSRRPTPEPGPTTSTIAQVKTPAATDTQTSQRVLVLVVGDHLESSERVLTEVANADPKRGEYDSSDAQQRAAELVASNRIYRQTASQHGDERIASLLSDLEPILVELAHAGKTLSPGELASIQKRIETKGLLFKVRVMSAQNDADGGTRTPRAAAGNRS